MLRGYTFDFMKTTTIKIAILALVLFGLTACSNTQSVPNMVDYSYVPQSKTITVYTAPGIEAY